jgi:methyl-accepting chemotaxis protein
VNSLKFKTFKVKHRAWKTGLKDFLEGKDGLTEEQAISHKDCSLGKWMYAEGLQHYTTLPEMKRLETAHINLHEIVKNIVSLKKESKAADADIEYQKAGSENCDEEIFC